jgi:GGDEF domain-containing protein
LHVATVLKGRLRESDVVARIGRDDFAVLLPYASPEFAADVAALAGELGAEDALRATDRAMYGVKRARRA